MDGADAVPLLQEVRGTSVQEGMARDGLGHPRTPDRVFCRPREDRLVHVVAAEDTGPPGAGKRGGRVRTRHGRAGGKADGCVCEL